MSEWVLGCVDGWVRGWVGAWVRGRVGAWMHDCAGAWSRGCVDRLLRVVEWCMREKDPLCERQCV